MIEDVRITPLRRIADERGYVMHFLRNDSPALQSIGEVYFSVAYPGVVKAWHLHLERTLNYAVIKGMAKVALYDDRKDSRTRGELMELFIGDQNYQLVTVPTKVWNGIKCIGASEAMVAICMDGPYDEKEIERIDPFKNDIPYDWSLKQG